MTVGVVVDALSIHFGGGGTALVEELAALERVAPDLDLQVLAAPWNVHGLRAALGCEVRPVAVGEGPARVLWEQLVLPWLGRRPGVLYCPGNLAPLAPTRLPVVLAVQNPNLVGRGRRLPHNRRWHRRVRVAACRLSMSRARSIVAVSESLRAEIVADRPDLADRVTVVPLGPPTPARPPRRPAALPPEVADFLLVLANDAPHKRLDDAVAAWGRAFGDDPASAPHLVLAGMVEDRRRTSHHHLVPERLRPRLAHLGPVTDRREVTWLLGHARALVSASELESFGLTTLEAGSLGCALLLSDIPAHREVAGAHATFTPPRNVAALADALARTDPSPQRRPWAWPVTWEDHAERLAAVLRAAAGVG